MTFGRTYSLSCQSSFSSKLVLASLLVLGSFLFKSAVVTYYFSNLSPFALSYVIGSEEEEEETVHSSVDHFRKNHTEYPISFPDADAVECHRPHGITLLYQCEQGQIPLPPPEACLI